MSTFKLRALASACALLGASGLAMSSAHAQSAVYGGGSSLLAPYWGQAADCYSTANTTYYVKGTPVTTATPLATTGCSPVSGVTIGFDSTGSGTGQVGLFAHDAIIGTALDSSGAFQPGTSSLDFGTAIGGTLASEVFPTIQYGLSDNSLVGTDLAVYNVGTGNTLVTTYHGDAATYVAPASYQAMTFTSTATPHNGGTNSTAYPIPLNRYGPLVQFPASIDPVALAYNPTYTSYNSDGSVNGTYSFRVLVHPANDTTNANGGMELSQAAYCGIYQHTITDWADPTLTALNGGTPLTAMGDTGTSHPIYIAGRSDSSGTTSIFTRHMSAVCGSGVWGTSGTTTLPASVTSSPNYLPGNGSSGVASAIHGTPGAIGYIGPDYALPYVTNTGANNYGLNVAALLNAKDSMFYEPTPAGASTSFGSVLPPQTRANGNYNPSDTTSDRRDPTQWVQSTASTAPLANPTNATTGVAAGYPLVGTSNFIGYTCYAASSSVTDLDNFLTYDEVNAGARTILTNAGLANLPDIWLNAINQTFVSPTSATSGLNLFFATAGSSSTNSNCTSVAGG